MDLVICMKKAFVSPLCSAFIIPGLGQILNESLRKGVSILIAVFALLFLAALGMFRAVRSAMEQPDGSYTAPSGLLDGLRAEDFSFLWYVLIVFAVLWIYSVVDAYVEGRKRDRLEKKEPA